jgi:hypothetical protein
MPKNITAIILGGTLITGLVGGGSYYIWNQNQQKKDEKSQNGNNQRNAKTFNHPIAKLKEDCKKPEICGTIDQDIATYTKIFPTQERQPGQNNGNRGQGNGGNRANLTDQEREKLDKERKERRPYQDKFSAFCRQAHPEFQDNKKFNATGNISRTNKEEFTCRFWEN